VVIGVVRGVGEPCGIEVKPIVAEVGPVHGWRGPMMVRCSRGRHRRQLGWRGPGGRPGAQRG
jgi:hypothetical protein